MTELPVYIEKIFMIATTCTSPYIHVAYTIGELTFIHYKLHTRNYRVSMAKAKQTSQLQLKKKEELP